MGSAFSVCRTELGCVTVGQGSYIVQGLLLSVYVPTVKWEKVKQNLDKSRAWLQARALPDTSQVIAEPLCPFCKVGVITPYLLSGQSKATTQVRKY